MKKTVITEQVILVNKNNKKIGSAEKLYAHTHQLLHRAFSIFIYHRTNNTIKFLLQKRNKAKYHSGGLWSNTCCGHPRPKENTANAAVRRLKEEVGIKLPLINIGYSYYKANLDNNLTEHELDYIFLGQLYAEEININTDEIEDVCWLSSTDINNKLILTPKDFSAWFQITWGIADNYAKSI